MSNIDRRTREAPPEVADVVRAELERAGANAAARALGVGRQVVLAIAAGQKVLPGSLALIREHISRQGIVASAINAGDPVRGRVF